MATDFRALPIKQFAPSVHKKRTDEEVIWQSFQFPTVVKEYTAINRVQFANKKPYNCLVTCSGKLQVFAPYTHEVKRTYTRNKENYYGGVFRSDGKLIAVGGESGVVQVLDATSRSILRNFNGHTKPTHVCCFGKEPGHVFTASDDKTFRCWDLASQKEKFVTKAHKDFIRCGCVSEFNANLFVTASYDHLVRVWDTRTHMGGDDAHTHATHTMEMNHGAPVECVLMHPNGSVCLSAGSNYVKVWDLLNGGELYTQFSSHQKTITTMCYDGDCSRLLTASLDRHVKVHSAGDYAVVASMDYPSPILSMDISKDSNHLVVGMSDGAISLRNKAKPSVNPTQKRKRPAQPGTYGFRMRNMSSKPQEGDVVVDIKKRRREILVDTCLRKYQYHDALDAVCCEDRHDHASIITSLIMELSRRDALEIALSNRTAESLVNIVKFLTRNIIKPAYTARLIPVANLLIDMYAHMFGADREFDKLMAYLSYTIRDVLPEQKKMIQLAGAIEQIFNMANVAPSVDDECEEAPIQPLMCDDEQDEKSNNKVESLVNTDLIEENEEIEEIEDNTADTEETEDVSNENVEEVDTAAVVTGEEVLVNGFAHETEDPDCSSDDVDFVIGTN